VTETEATLTVEAKKPTSGKEGIPEPADDKQTTDGNIESEGDDSEDESEILEESPCGRWLKRREVVSYRDVPGIDCAYLAMDTEEGVEVVWNEAAFSEAKKFKAQEDKLRSVFKRLTLIDHPNIVKFHKYWTDEGKPDDKNKDNVKPRVVLITEYMSSGSLKQFLRKTKKNSRKIPLQSWRRWCNQILSALSYLHSFKEPIIHGNLTCDTIFIQHNGLVKIGSVAPDAIHKNVKTFRENIKNFHFLAPEWADDTITLTPAIDIFAFGMCALETAALEITTNTESSQGPVSKEAIEKCIESLEDEGQKDFIRKCLIKDPCLRPKARDLLFHPILFEVPSLKLLAAHTLVSDTQATTENLSSNYYGTKTTVMATKTAAGEMEQYKLKDYASHEKLEKFMEDVKNGIYPLTAFVQVEPPDNQMRPPSPQNENVDKELDEQVDVETRRILTMQCDLEESDKKEGQLSLRILLRFDDNMNRQLNCMISRDSDSAQLLAEELVLHGFIHTMDSLAIQQMLETTFHKYESNGTMQLPAEVIVQ